MYGRCYPSPSEDTKARRDRGCVLNKKMVVESLVLMYGYLSHSLCRCRCVTHFAPVRCCDMVPMISRVLPLTQESAHLDLNAAENLFQVQVFPPFAVIELLLRCSRQLDLYPGSLIPVSYSLFVLCYSSFLDWTGLIADTQL